MKIMVLAVLMIVAKGPGPCANHKDCQLRSKQLKCTYELLRTRKLTTEDKVQWIQGVAEGTMMPPQECIKVDKADDK